MKIDHIFPIPIARFTVDETIIKNTTELVNKYVVDSDITYPSAPGELLTTFYKDKNLFTPIDYHSKDELKYCKYNEREGQYQKGTPSQKHAEV